MISQKYSLTALLCFYSFSSLAAQDGSALLTGLQDKSPQIRIRSSTQLIEMGDAALPALNVDKWDCKDGKLTVRQGTGYSPAEPKKLQKCPRFNEALYQAIAALIGLAKRGNQKAVHALCDLDTCSNGSSVVNSVSESDQLDEILQKAKKTWQDQLQIGNQDFAGKTKLIPTAEKGLSGAKVQLFEKCAVRSESTPAAGATFPCQARVMISDQNGSREKDFAWNLGFTNGNGLKHEWLETAPQGPIALFYRQEGMFADRGSLFMIEVLDRKSLNVICGVQAFANKPLTAARLLSYVGIKGQNCVLQAPKAKSTEFNELTLFGPLRGEGKRVTVKTITGQEAGN